MMNKILRLNGLCLVFVFFLHGCGGTNIAIRESSQSSPIVENKNTIQQGANIQQTSSIPNIIWTEREKYEHEGQIVFFSDCGLYKENGKDFIGIKCVYKKKWVCIDAEIKQFDNLSTLKNLSDIGFETRDTELSLKPNREYGGFLFGRVWYPGLGSSKIIKNEVYSKPYALKLISWNYPECILYESIPEKKRITNNNIYKYENDHFQNKYITYSFYRKIKYLKGKIKILLGSSPEQELNNNEIELKNSDDDFTETVITYKMPLSSRGITLKFIIPKNTEIILDDFTLVRGYFPMGFSS